MAKLLKILKINILSLVAIPLLLLATAFKLIAKSLEKIPLFIGLAIASSIILSLSSFSATMESIFTIIAGIIACLILFGLIIVLLLWIFTLISGLVMLLYSLVVGSFEGLYGIAYNGYLFLFTVCESDYQVLSLNGKKTANAFLCPFYSILRALSWLITTVVSFSLPAGIILSVGLVVTTLYDLNRNVRTAFGLNLIQFAQKSQTASVIGGIFIYLAVMAICATAILSFALEWYEWAQDLKMSGLEISEDIAQLQQQEFRMEEDSIPEEWMEINGKYLRSLEEHFNRLDSLGNQIQDILSKKDSPLLRSSWGTYMRSLNELSEECSSKNGISLEQFKKMIPRIQQLDRQRDDVRRMADKLTDELRSPGGNTVFFAGCDTYEKLEKRYKSLCKTYHPDSDGDTATFQKMQNEYESLKTMFSAEKQPS